MRTGYVGLAMVVLAGCSSSSDPTKKVTASQYGDKWPMTVTSGTLTCHPGRQVTFTAGGKEYYVNGTAKGAGKYADLMSIWADDPGIPGAKKEMVLTDDGLALCKD